MFFDKVMLSLTENPSPYRWKEVNEKTPDNLLWILKKAEELMENLFSEKVDMAKLQQSIDSDQPYVPSK